MTAVTQPQASSTVAQKVSITTAFALPELIPAKEAKNAMPVARAYLDQLVRDNGVQPSVSTRVAGALRRAEAARGAARRAQLTALAAQLDRDAARAADAAKVRTLAGVVRDMARVRG